MQVVGQVGPPGPVSSGAASTPLRQGNLGDVIVSELNGRYYENAVRGNVFVAAQTAGTVAIAATTGSTTLCLFNPNNSGINLILLDVIVAIEAQAAAATQSFTIQLAGNATGATQTLTTPLTTYSSIVGSGKKATGVALVSSTFSNSALVLRNIGSLSQLVITTSGGSITQTSFKDEIAGAVIVPPGSFVGIYVLTGGTIGDLTLASSMTWAEASSTVL